MLCASPGASGTGRAAALPTLTTTKPHAPPAACYIGIYLRVNSRELLKELTAGIYEICRILPCSSPRRTAAAHSRRASAPRCRCGRTPPPLWCWATRHGAGRAARLLFSPDGSARNSARRLKADDLRMNGMDLLKESTAGILTAGGRGGQQHSRHSCRHSTGQAPQPGRAVQGYQQQQHTQSAGRSTQAAAAAAAGPAAAQPGTVVESEVRAEAAVRRRVRPAHLKRDSLTE